MPTSELLETPPLYVVVKFGVGQTPQEPDRVKSDLGEHIRRFFENPRATDPGIDLAATELLRLSIAGLWLMCGCRGAPGTTSPVLYAQRVPGGRVRKVALVPIYARAEHHNCPFARVAPDNSDQPSQQPRAAKRGGFGVLAAFGDDDDERVARARDPDATRTSSRTTMPTIARVMFTLIDGAKVNVLLGRDPVNGKSLPKKNVTTDKEKIRAYLKDKTFGRGPALAALDYFSFSFSTLPNLIEKLKSAPSEAWGNLHPHGFLIDQVSDYRKVDDGYEIESAYQATIKLDGRLYVPGEDTPGPWLAICLVTQLPNTKSHQVYRAYLHPLESYDSLMLVDSDLERKTLGILRRKRSQMLRANNPYDIIKPVLDMTPADQSEVDRVRPDFIVRNAIGSMVVETMGYTDAEYLERKKRTHQAMKSLEGIWRLIEHETGQDATFKNEVYNFIALKSRATD